MAMSRFSLTILTILSSLIVCGSLSHAGPVTGYDVSGDEETSPGLEHDDFDFEDEFEDDFGFGVPDPLRGYNRFVSGFNDSLYYWVMKPVAGGYCRIVPEPARLAMGRCFRNILFPVRLVNNLLQLKLKRAGTECMRFGVNTTIGILGFRDPGKTWLRLDPYPEDFGQTLGHYGLGSGFHLVLPVLGPSNLRDTLGMVPDFFLNPTHYMDAGKYEIAVEGYKRVNYVSLHIGEYESLQNDAVDFYILLRDAYENKRRAEIKE